MAEDRDLKQFLKMLDGLVLCGCPLDLDPVRLGMERHPATRSMPLRREDFDRRLCKLAYDMRLPILAIGVGMQELNVVCGGTLHQHIPEEFQKPLHHRDPVESTLRHIIEIVPGTRMDAIYGPGEIRVNSQHHMCIDQVAEPFRVSATSPDGVIEAYETGTKSGGASACSGTRRTNRPRRSTCRSSSSSSTPAASAGRPRNVESGLAARPMTTGRGGCWGA